MSRVWPAIGPSLLAVLLTIRAFAGGGTSPAILLGVAGVLVGVAVAASRQVAAAPLLQLIGPAALLGTPARTELSFNLARPGDTGWFVFTVLVALGVGLSLAAAVTALTADRVGTRALVPAAFGAVALGAVGFAGAAWAVDPQPDLGRGLDAAARESLPVVTMVNYAFGAEPVPVVDGRLRVKLENPSDLPHAFSIDALDLDVYVPAGREAYVDVEVPDTTVDRYDLYCSVGDHTELGMVTELLVG